MILEQGRLLITQTFRDIPPLLGGEHDAVELAVDDVVVVEGAGVLGDDVEFLAEGAEGPAVDAVAVGGAEDVRSRLVDRGVNHVGGGVEEAAGAAIDDLTGVVDLDEVAGFDEGEGYAEGIDPEGCGIDGIS
jgi:hypothetical protein